jgi:hypothetical protein
MAGSSPESKGGESMNYEAMWEMLKAEIAYLESRGVRELHLAVVLELMGNIYDLENAREEIAAYIRLAVKPEVKTE